jgi:hydroxymethylpyrimidine pyrophosphatase-like HAD family hydrolase
MYFLALAADYDGTIAHDGVVEDQTKAALERFKKTGRKLLLVTGRELPDLKRRFPQLGIFDRVVAENGALIYDPANDRERTIAPPPPPELVKLLQRRNVAPLSVGRSIVATWHPQETVVLEVIRELGLEMQIIFNKGAVMVLPSGINKAAGLAAALAELELSAHNVVGVGDAENDHAFLRACGCAAAVANALPTVQEAADIRLAGERGAGVIELVEMVCREDARIVPPERHGILIGRRDGGKDVYLEPHRGSVLIAGSSGIGKSTLAIALSERMAEKKFEFCVFDPEGDYNELEGAIVVGDVKTTPKTDDAIKLLHQAEVNVVVNTQALDVQERPPFFGKLLGQISELRARTGRPHWLIIDEAHHLMPASLQGLAQLLPEEIPAAIFITVHPEAVSLDVLDAVEVVVALGDKAPDVIEKFCAATGVAAPASLPVPALDEVVIWRPRSDDAPHTR